MNRIAKFLMLAVAVVAIGAATATAATLITGKQVKNKSLTGKDIKNASLGPAVLNAAAKAALKGPKGDDGAKGAKGADGATGPTGPAGATAVHTHRRAEGVATAQNRTVATQTLPAGLYQVTSTFLITSPDGGKTQKCALQTGAAKEIAAETFSAGVGERLSLTIAGAVEIPAAAAGADAQVRVACTVDGDVAPVTNISIVSTRTAGAPVTTE